MAMDVLGIFSFIMTVVLLLFIIDNNGIHIYKLWCKIILVPGFEIIEVDRKNKSGIIFIYVQNPLKYKSIDKLSKDL